METHNFYKIYVLQSEQPRTTKESTDWVYLSQFDRKQQIEPEEIETLQTTVASLIDNHKT